MKKNNKMKFILIGILILVIGGGVILSNKGKKTSGIKDGITITHRLGETVIENDINRVAVFDYGILDSLDNLGVDIVGLPKESLPSYLKKYNDEKYINLGTLKEVNMEKLYEAKPDLIIISGRLEESYGELSKIAPTIYMGVDNNDYMGSFKDNMRILGEIFDKESLVEEKISALEKKIEEVNKLATEKKGKGLIALANDGAFSIYGEGSRFGIIHKEFGIDAIDKTIEASKHGQKASFEYILDKNPDYLFVVDRGAVVGGQTSAKEMFNNEIMEKTNAYKNGKIIYLSADIWYTAVGGFTSTEMMVEEVKKAL